MVRRTSERGGMSGMPMLLLQLAGEAVPTTPWEMIVHATTATKAVLVILALLSLISWAIIVAKLREYGAAESAGRQFMRQFEQARDLNEASQLARVSAQSPFTRVYSHAINFVAGLTASGTGREGALTESQVAALRLVLDSQTARERDRLAALVPWLATIGSVSPLLGLLGTVVGVIVAFIGIAVQGAGNLAAVAPGVAEALTATAAALAVAIPAVFGYNIFAARLNRLDSELERFGTEIIAMMVREGRI